MNDYIFSDTGNKLSKCAKILFWVEVSAVVLANLVVMVLALFDGGNEALGLILLLDAFIILVAYVKCLFLIVVADIWDSVVK